VSSAWIKIRGLVMGARLTRDTDEGSWCENVTRCWQMHLCHSVSCYRVVCNLNYRQYVCALDECCFLEVGHPFFTLLLERVDNDLTGWIRIDHANKTRQYNKTNDVG